MSDHVQKIRDVWALNEEWKTEFNISELYEIRDNTNQIFAIPEDITNFAFINDLDLASRQIHELLPKKNNVQQQFCARCLFFQVQGFWRTGGSSRVSRRQQNKREMTWDVRHHANAVSWSRLSRHIPPSGQWSHRSLAKIRLESQPRWALWRWQTDERTQRTTENALLASRCSSGLSGSLHSAEEVNDVAR